MQISKATSNRRPSNWFQDSSDATGHTSTINITGDYWDVDLIQRSTNNNDWVNINATGSGTQGSHATLCIVQNDSGYVANDPD